MTNGAHASVAAVIESMGTPETKEYLFSIDDMRKVSLLVESDRLYFFNFYLFSDDLIQMSEELSKAGLPHKLWIEKPENIPVCIATAVCSVFSFFNSQPNVKSRLFSILGHLKLLR